MTKIIKKIDWVIGKCSEGMSFGASVMIMILMVAVSADVVLRFFFHKPIMGLMEIVRASIPIICFFMIPWCTHEFRHVRSTLIYGRVPLKGRIVMDVIFYAMGAFFFFTVLWGGWPELTSAIAYGDFEGEGSLRVPTWPTRLLILVSSVLTIWQMVRCMVMSVVDPQEEVPLGE